MLFPRRVGRAAALLHARLTPDMHSPRFVFTATTCLSHERASDRRVPGCVYAVAGLVYAGPLPRTGVSQLSTGVCTVRATLTPGRVRAAAAFSG